MPKLCKLSKDITFILLTHQQRTLLLVYLYTRKDKDASIKTSILCCISRMCMKSSQVLTGKMPSTMQSVIVKCSSLWLLLVMERPNGQIERFVIIAACIVFLLILTNCLNYLCCRKCMRYYSMVNG